MGVQFKIPFGDLKSFELECNTTQERLTQVVDWLGRNRKMKWSYICRVLETRSVGEASLASNLRNNYCVPTPGIVMLLFGHHMS